MKEPQVEERASVKVLREAIDLQNRKSADYQNPSSDIVQSMHYRRGIDTIHDMMHQKMLRAQSLLEAKTSPNNESIEDTYMDLINYASFAVAYLRGDMEGQTEERDIFNRPKFGKKAEQPRVQAKPLPAPKPSETHKYTLLSENLPSAKDNNDEFAEGSADDNLGAAQALLANVSDALAKKDAERAGEAPVKAVQPTASKSDLDRINSTLKGVEPLVKAKRKVGPDRGKGDGEEKSFHGDRN